MRESRIAEEEAAHAEEADAPRIRFGIFTPIQNTTYEDLATTWKEAEALGLGQDRQVLKTGGAVQRETDVRLADGEIHRIAVTRFPVRDAQGRVSGAVLSIHEITELRHLEQVRQDFVGTAGYGLCGRIAAQRRVEAAGAKVIELLFIITQIKNRQSHWLLN